MTLRQLALINDLNNRYLRIRYFTEFKRLRHEAKLDNRYFRDFEKAFENLIYYCDESKEIFESCFNYCDNALKIMEKRYNDK